MHKCSLQGLHVLIRHAHFPAKTPERLAFQRKLDQVAAAIQEIERSESGDQPSVQDETRAIVACLGDTSDSMTALLAEYLRTLSTVLKAFDCDEHRDAGRHELESHALQSVYRLLAKPWPDGSPRRVDTL